MIKKKVKRIIIASATAVVVAAGGITGFMIYAKSDSAASTTTFRQISVQKGSISTTVSGSGSVSDASQVTLTASNAGTIDSISVKQGDTVTAGQVIAHVSETNTAQTVAQKESALASAKNALTQSEDNLSNLYIKSPAAGKVKSIQASAGDDLSTIKSLGDLAVISTSRSMKVSFNPSKTLTVGQTVTVVDGSSSYTGTVTSTSGGASAGSAQGGGNTSSGSTVVTIATDDPGVGDSVSIYSDGSEVGTGSLELVSYKSVSNSGNGKISNVYVKENQMVAKSANLFKLDSSSVENDISLKKQAVTTAQNDLTEAQENAAKDTITSPVSGVVAELDIKSGDSVSQGSTVAVIFDPDAMQTVISVDELDISKVEVGQKASITLDAVTGKTFSGSVTQVDPIGTSSNGVATYSVTVMIDDPEGIKIGMTTNAEIITESKDNTIVVSSGAVLEKNGTSAYVLMAKDLIDSSGKSIQLENVTTRELIKKYGRKVTTGISTTDKVEIVSGLSEGDSIAIPITINKAALKSLSNTTSSSSFNMGGFGGMGGTEGMGGMNRSYRSNNKTGNTVSASNNTTGSTNSGSTTGGSTTGGTAGGGSTGTAKSGGM